MNDLKLAHKHFQSGVFVGLFQRKEQNIFWASDSKITSNKNIKPLGF